jgi:hypothetical protein
MKTLQEVVRGAMKIGLAGLGLLYAIEVIRMYAKAGEHERPAFDPAEVIESTERLLIWVGVILIRVSIRISRPVLDVLSEASADLGEWALARHAAGAPSRGRQG